MVTTFAIHEGGRGEGVQLRRIIHYETSGTFQMLKVFPQNSGSKTGGLDLKLLVKN